MKRVVFTLNDWGERSVLMQAAELIDKPIDLKPGELFDTVNDELSRYFPGFVGKIYIYVYDKQSAIILRAPDHVKGLEIEE